jgi:hypothetical protein
VRVDAGETSEDDENGSKEEPQNEQDVGGTSKMRYFVLMYSYFEAIREYMPFFMPSLVGRSDSERGGLMPMSL